MSEVLRFNMNVPEQVSLQYPEGKRVQGRYGEQVMYSLSDGRVMYVPLYVEQRINELAIGAAEPIELCKAEVRDGNRRWVEWHIQRSEGPQQPPPRANGTAAVAQVLSDAQNLSHPSTNHSVNGNGRYQVPWVPPQTLLPMRVNGNGVPAMELALEEAVAIARRIEARAAAENYYLRFNSNDIRSMGVSIFIQMSRDEASKW